MPFETQELAKFGQAGRAISAAVGVGFEMWAMGEAAVVCKQWAGHIPEAMPDAARLRSRGRARNKAGVGSLDKFSVTANTGRFGGQIGLLWFRTRRGKFIKAGEVSDSGAVSQPRRRFTESDWTKVVSAQSAFSALLPKAIEAGQRAIGLARQSVLQIADSLGLNLETAAGGGGADFSRARAARASDGREYINGFGYKFGQGDKFTVTLVDIYPYIQEAGIDQALELVVAQRMAYHEVNLALALKKDLRAVEQAYPYLQITA